MTKAPNILALSNSIGKGYADYVNVSTADTMKETQDVMNQYNTESKEIQEQYASMFGTSGRGIIDPNSFINIESLDAFLSRTLITGSDVNDLSFAFIDNFTDITLDLTLP